MKQIQNLYSIATFLFILLLGYHPGLSAQDLSDSFISETQDLTAIYEVPKIIMQQKVDLNVENVDIKKVLSVLENQADLIFSYEENTIAGLKNISVHFTHTPLKKVLSKLFQDTGISFKLVKGKYIVLTKQKISSRDKMVRESLQSTVTGVVTNAKTDKPLIGVNILVMGTTTGTITGTDGRYSVNVSSLNDTLRFSFIGFQTQIVPINGRTEINIQLVPTVLKGQQVVVVGYGTAKRTNVTGAISSIDAKEVQGKAVSSVEQVMQGKIPGVQIRPTSGEPGAPMQVQIRGIGTFGNADPLYIVDGIPMQSADMASIPTSMIKSIEVLKDASAAAIYGSRAANGVILITTKDGQNGELQFDYNGYVGIQSFTDFIPLLNAKQYAAVVNESTAASGLPPDPAYNNPKNLQHSTNWQAAAFRPAPITSHTLRVSGGSDFATYSVGGNYFYQKGIMVFNYLKRFSTNIKTKFEITDKLTIGESLILSKTSGLNRNRGNNLDFAYMLGASPTMRIYNSDNKGGYAGPNPKQTGINNRDNIIERRDFRSPKSNTNMLLANLYLEYNFLPSLQYQFSFGINASKNKTKLFVPVFEAGNRTNPTASLTKTFLSHSHTLLQNLLTYEKDFGVNFSLNLLAGYSQEVDVQKNFSGSINGFPDNSLQVIDAGTGTYTIGGNKSKFTLRSYFAKANIKLYNKYLFTATFRRDGSSRFGEDYKYGNFPSLAAGWIVSNEDFMKGVQWLSNLKIRASWGRLGNQNLGDYANITTVALGQRYAFGGEIAPGAAVTSLGNPQIRWETTTQTDIGFNMGFLNNRLTVTGDFYVKKTKDVLLRVPITVATGMARNNGPFLNAASIKNTGMGFGVSYSEYGDNFSYTISGNISTVKNTVTSLGGLSSIINFVSNAYNIGTYTYTAVGYPISSYYGYIMEGIFQTEEQIDNHALQPGAEPGDVIFKDINGDKIINSEDRTVIGNPFPNFRYGLSGTLNYRNFDLSITISGVQGRYLYNALRGYLESLNGEYNQRVSVLNRWHGPGTSHTMPRATRADPNNNSRSSTRFIDNASYLRLQSLQVGYTFPNIEGVRNLRIYLNAQNLFTITPYPGYNPAVRGGSGWTQVSGNPLTIGVDTGAYPVPKIFQIGIQLGL